MIPFIKELNDPNNVTLKLIDKYYYKDIKIDSLPDNLINECYDVIKELDRLNPLELTKEEKNYEFTNYHVDSNNGLYTNNILNDYDEDLNFYRFDGYDLYRGLKSGIKSFNICGITNNGFNKMMELLRNYIINYKEEIDKISKMDFPDFLVRCCGFHKVESQVNKTITTSLVNYEDAFSEYINRGWKVDFIPPIVLNNGVLEEYNNDFLVVRKALKLEK